MALSRRLLAGRVRDPSLSALLDPYSILLVDAGGGLAWKGCGGTVPKGALLVAVKRKGDAKQ